MRHQETIARSQQLIKRLDAMLARFAEFPEEPEGD
jgi:hypothetical protein